jgi:hypothetical protein
MEWSMDEHLLSLAFRLMRALVGRGVLTAEDAGRLAARLGMKDWRERSDQERADWIAWAEMALGWLMEDTDLPIEQTAEGWRAVYTERPIACPSCGRIVGWATPGGELELVGPALIRVRKGELRCPCGCLVKWGSRAAPSSPEKARAHAMA